MCIHDLLCNLHDMYRRAWTDLFNPLAISDVKLVECGASYSVQTLMHYVDSLQLFIRCCLDKWRLLHNFWLPVLWNSCLVRGGMTFGANNKSWQKIAVPAYPIFTTITPGPEVGSFTLLNTYQTGAIVHMSKMVMNKYIFTFFVSLKCFRRIFLVLKARNATTKINIPTSPRTKVSHVWR